MTERDDGGRPAFSVPGLTNLPNDQWIYPQNGMSLRDWFAGQALTGICGHIAGAKIRDNETHAQAQARFSYNLADAMLAERQKGGAS